MNKFVFFTLLALILSPINSCKKDEDPPTKTELLTDGIWEGVSIKGYINNVLDYTESITHYTFDFIMDNTLVVTDTEVNDVDIIAWSFASNKTQIIFDGDIFTIEKLTSASLIFSYTQIDEDETSKEVITLKR